MRAIILAAGRGKRLVGHDEPKCLLEFGGRTLLDRHLDALSRLGVEEIVLVVGYRAEDVLRALDGTAAGRRHERVANPEFERGSVLSLWAAREALERGGDVLVMDADVLYDIRILEKLTRSNRSTLLLDRGFEEGDEPVKLCIRDGVAVEFRKTLPPDLEFDYAGESVGFFRFDEPVARALAGRTRAYADAGRGDEPHEEAIRDLLLDDPGAFCVEDVTGLPWVEIDFPDDIRRAEQEILPRLSAPESRSLDHERQGKRQRA